MNRKQREQNKLTAAKLKRTIPPTKKCFNCGRLDYHGHFIPPSFGEEGFYTCESLKNQPLTK